MSKYISGQEKEDILDERHWQLKDFKQRMITKDWKKLLMSYEDKIIYKGELIALIARNIGYGIVEVSKKIDELEDAHKEIEG